MKILFQIVLLISRLPLKVHYLFADFLFFMNYYIIGYRKKVVFTNLKNSFPEKSNIELQTISKSFFRNFSDYIVETVKSFTISSNELKVRVQHLNQDVFHQAKKEGKNVILLTGHVFNWEWYNALATVLPQKNTYAVYRKVNNSFWNDQIKKIRGNYGNTAIEANEVLKHIFRNPNNGDSAYMFVADASPHINMVDYGVRFLNQNTPAFIGYDKLATRMDFHFVYCDMKKVKRGFYQVNYYRIKPDGEKFKEFEVVDKFHALLEETIRKRPDNYLWSHRKWKYQHAIKNFKK
ncbi:MAG: lysophospholipid acyltransferase family protein [Bacteroidetes bacterium]|nr:lysophospholipid acyltransferase family protein [Bacteroidota bacterium]